MNGIYKPDWKFKARCKKCGHILSSSVSKTNGYCRECDPIGARFAKHRKVKNVSAR